MGDAKIELVLKKMIFLPLDIIYLSISESAKTSQVNFNKNEV